VCQISDVPSFDRLLSPCAIGPMTLRNRIVMPAMDQNSCTDEGIVTDLTIEHYRERARGGVGLLILETSAVAYPRGATSIHQPSLSHDGAIEPLSRLAAVVHEHGAKLIVQLCHHGKTSSVDTAQGLPVLVPSLPTPPDVDPMGMVAGTTIDELMRMATLTGGKRARSVEASVTDLENVCGAFVDAAERVQRAGIDGVEIHAAHGYLLSTLLSPAWNRRTDHYGGDAAGRARLLTDIVAGIRARCGESFAVVVRLDGIEHGVADGITVTQAAATAALVEEIGAHAIHVSATSSSGTGVGFTEGPLPWTPGQYAELAHTVKRAVRIPVIAVGRISPVLGEELLQRGVCDFVAMGRQLLADPELANRLAAGRPDLVRPCINCFLCVAQNFWDGRPVCAVNARLGHYESQPPMPAASTRRVVVVGGGPAGMEAARVAAERGHHVTLLERGPHLGGTARFSSLTTPMNGELVTYLTAAVKEAGVDVRLSTPADVDTVRALTPDVVVVATGARRSRLSVPGGDLPHVLSGDDLRSLLTGRDMEGGRKLPLRQRAMVAAGRRLGLTDDMDRVRTLSRTWMPVGDRVVVIGGGLVGVELAEFLAERRRSVTVLEESPWIGAEMAHPRRWRAMYEARAHGVEFVVKAAVESINESTVVASVEAAQKEYPADTVIVATGVEPDDSLAVELRAVGLEVHVIGDASRVGYIEGAIRSGYEIGKTL
jgi:2,4-dienoyl-CoA reductase-like NADH-dependent reductase (Old Yellow Enzyme family)/thioredoxin reductase